MHCRGYGGGLYQDFACTVSARPKAWFLDLEVVSMVDALGWRSAAEASCRN